MYVPPPGNPPAHLPPMHMPPPGATPESTPAYRPGPKSRLQFLNQSYFNQAPPPPPPPGPPGPPPLPGAGGSMHSMQVPPPQKKQNITQDDISSFMDQWVEQPPTNVYNTGSNPTPPPGPKIIDHAHRPSQEAPQEAPS